MELMYNSNINNVYTPEATYMTAGTAVTGRMRTTASSIPASDFASHSISEMIGSGGSSLFSFSGFTVFINDQSIKKQVFANNSNVPEVFAAVMFANEAEISLPLPGESVSGELQPIFDLSVPLIRTIDMSEEASDETSGGAESIDSFIQFIQVVTGKTPVREVPEGYSRKISYTISNLRHIGDGIMEYEISYVLNESVSGTKQYGQIEVLKEDSDGTKSVEYVRTSPSSIATRIASESDAANATVKDGVLFLDGFPVNVNADNLAAGGICYEVETVVGEEEEEIPVEPSFPVGPQGPQMG